MIYLGLYSFFLWTSENGFGEAGVKIIDYDQLMKFIKEYPIKGLKALYDERKRPDQNEPDKRYYLYALEAESGYENLSRGHGHVIEGLGYTHNRKEFLEFWSRLSEFTDPFFFAHSGTSHDLIEPTKENIQEQVLRTGLYQVYCDKENRTNTKLIIDKEEEHEYRVYCDNSHIIVTKYKKGLKEFIIEDGKKVIKGEKVEDFYPNK